MDLSIRPATGDDLEAINRIYNAYIVDSHVSFDTEAWSADRRTAWWEDYAGRVLVADRESRVVGSAFFGPWRRKEAYRGSAETTVVLDPDATGAGVGTALLARLLERLRADGYHRAYAIIALPNEVSVAVHRKLGYREVGVLDEVGFKMDRYWSTLLMECPLS